MIMSADEVAAEKDLVSRVQDKVKAKWGAKPPEWQPSPGDARLVGLGPEGEVDPSPVFPMPPEKDLLPVPRGLVVGIHQMAMVQADFRDFIVVLEVNGERFQARFRVSHATLMMLRGRESQAEMLLRQMVSVATGAIMESIRRGVTEDIEAYIREEKWRGQAGQGVFPLSLD